MSTSLSFLHGAHNLDADQSERVNSKATLRLSVDKCSTFMPEFMIQRFQENAKTHLTKNLNEVVIQSDNTRKQADNTDECFRKLYRMIVDSANLPGETTKEQHDHVVKL